MTESGLDSLAHREGPEQQEYPVRDFIRKPNKEGGGGGEEEEEKGSPDTSS